MSIDPKIASILAGLDSCSDDGSGLIGPQLAAVEDLTDHIDQCLRQIRRNVVAAGDSKELLESLIDEVAHYLNGIAFAVHDHGFASSYCNDRLIRNLNGIAR